jgi:hypothetical protein
MSRKTDDNDDGDSADGRPVRDRPDAPTVEHQWTDTASPHTSIVEAVAAATDRQPTDLPTLDTYVDGDALDALLCRGSSSVTVSFEYADCVVVARGDGTVRVTVTDPAPVQTDE